MSPHAADSLSGPDCASCHATHTAQAPALANTAAPQSNLCFTCHGGSTSTFDVRAEFQGVPANDPSTSSYYSHPATASSSHVLGTEDEFGGVLNRHAACADCHNPHDATATRPAQSTTGWTASGDVAGATGVAVANGAAATSPTYALIGPGVTGRLLTYEYQLCLKCHSGRTVLPAANPDHPSWWALDKGVELNPANASYHPIEAAGKNLSAQMQASLAGSSPFKAWTLDVDSTVRCTNCHGDPSTVNQTATAPPLQPSAATEEASHASPNRGLLIAPYRDRILKSAIERYDSADFALCYLCHAERPFKDTNIDPSSPDTSFSLHGSHLNSITSTGEGSSIDTPGAGQGLAICAECHFRIHSTALSYEPGDAAPVARATGSASLVNFAPDVVAAGTTPPTWTQPGANGVGSCTLTCHGFTHGEGTTTYTVAPGTGFTAAPTTGSLGSDGLVVHFTDATRYASAATATWNWDFGDGAVSTAVNPIHTYGAAGTYTVTLTVRRTADDLSTTMTRTGYVTITP